ncbi:acetyl-CoA C-acyltransferase [Congregibacter sp.]|uniref:acetyl-CoA C-acyltransferase n=1 Tax=Congregibacter sp. TaxID=2744308 RepID=UPI00385DCD40
MTSALIYGGVRSARARAKEGAALNGITPQELLAQLYTALGERTGLEPAHVDDVVLGCVTQHGEQAGNIAKASTLYAGWPFQVPGLTVNRYCSSGVDALALAALKIQGGVARQVVAGGVEMMSRVPMLADDARVFKDPGFATQCRMLMMGSGADLIASRAGVSREEADQVAFNSQQRAEKARKDGHFKASIVPIRTPDGEALEDECIRSGTTLEGLAAMDPVFAKIGASGVDAYQLKASPELDAINHIHTAGNSPAMADAACLLLLGDSDSAASLNVAPRARIADSVTVAADPLEVLTGCVEAVRALLDKTGLSADDIDLFEIHEAFAATSVVAEREFGLDAERHNVNGGVIALGHPMGATGAIMTLTLLDELERRGLRRGIVSAAGAAGSGSALLIDRDAGLFG